MQQITLHKKVPEKDGYYVVQFHVGGGYHLITIQTQFDLKRFILTNDLKKYDLDKCLYFSEEIRFDTV